MTSKIRKKKFFELGEFLFNFIEEKENLFLSLNGEMSSFTRINNGKIRQTTAVNQQFLTINFIKNDQIYEYLGPLTENLEANKLKYKKIILKLREDSQNMPGDPFVPLIKKHLDNVKMLVADNINKQEMVEDFMSSFDRIDIVGLLTEGCIERGFMSSLGQKCWYITNNFVIDYSIFNQNGKSVKGFYSDISWNKNILTSKILKSLGELKQLSKDPKNISPGKYRVYLAPAAVNDLLGVINWKGLSYSSFKKGACPLMKLHLGKISLSNKFNLSEDYSLGLSNSFNNFGEVAPDKLDLIKDGKLENALVSSKTSREFNKKSNGARDSEMMVSFKLDGGNISTEEILKTLDNGIYISNLHYLNWSNIENARITGMTRYGSFLVKNGRIVAPIEDMRFDDTVYSLFGDNLIGLTRELERFPNLHSYFERSLSGGIVPGALIREMNFSI